MHLIYQMYMYISSHQQNSIGQVMLTKLFVLVKFYLFLLQSRPTYNIQKSFYTIKYIISTHSMLFVINRFN